MADELARLQAAQQRTRDAYQAERNNFLQFIQTLKDLIAATPAGVLTAEQVTTLEAEADAFTAQIAENEIL